MGFRLSTPYYAVPGFRQEGGTFGAILQMLLRARVDLQMDSGSDLYDEDVNAYLGGVLVSYIDPQYLRVISGLVCRYDLDLFESVERAMPDRVRVYRIYKVNADDLLVTLGIFHQPGSEGPQPEMGRIKQYYACASDFQQRIYGKPTAVAEIQAKLSEETERYLAILSRTRRDYLHFIRQLSNEELDEFFHPPLTS